MDRYIYIYIIYIYFPTKLSDRIWTYSSSSPVSTECSSPWDKALLYCRIQECFQIYLQILEMSIEQSLITYTVTFTPTLPTILHVNVCTYLKVCVRNVTETFWMQLCCLIYFSSIKVKKMQRNVVLSSVYASCTANRRCKWLFIIFICFSICSWT